MITHAALAKKLVLVSHLKGEFRLRSGATSSEYFDKYRFEADPVILREVTEHLAGTVADGL
jgi:orotate phosphoribosyltransferase